MKKLSLIGLFALVVLAACNEKKETPDVTVETTNTTEAAPVAEPTPAAEDKKGTSIKVGSDGVEYSDKNTEIEISND